MKTTCAATLILPLLAGLAASASAAERIWDGGDATANLAAAANWDGNVPLNLAADDLNFPSGVAAADKTVNNNYPVNTVFRTLNFLDSGYTVNGTIMGLTNGVTGFYSSGNVNINASFSLQAEQTFSVDLGGALTFGPSSQIFVNGHDLLFHTIHGDSNIYVDGLLSGTSPNGIHIRGNPFWADDTSEVHFRGPKTFTAPITVESGGTLVIDDAGGLGQGAGGTKLVRGHLRIQSAAPLVIPEAFTLDDDNGGGQLSLIISNGGNHRLTGPISVVGSSTGIAVSSGTLTVDSSLNGFGYMDTGGDGTLILDGNQPNSFQGLYVNSGLVLLQKPPGMDATAANLHVGDFVGEGETIEVRHMAANQIPDFSAVTVRSEGLLNLNGFAETIGHLALEIPARISTGGATLRVNEDITVYGDVSDSSAMVTMSGNLRLGQADTVVSVTDAGSDALEEFRVTGSVSTVLPGASLTKTGNGDLRLSGNHALPLLNINDGSCWVDGNSPALNVVVSDATFGGLGAVGTIDGGNNSLVGVGLNSIYEMGTLASGDFTLTASTICRLGISGPAPGQHDQLNVTGTVTLGGATLTLDLIEPVTAQPGQEIMLISNDGTDPVTGQFNYAEGSLVLGESSISYHGGDGNDVTLTFIVPPTGTARLWDGGSAVDSNWMTANNWNPNGVPQPGDDLVFPTAAARKNNTNNFPAGTTFNSITVHGTGYGLGGNGILLNEKVEFTSASGSHFLNLPITLALDAAITLTGDAFIQATAPIVLNGHKLTLHNAGGGTGDLYISGNLTGTGRVWKTGPGTITFFEQPNTYAGPTDILEGALALKADATLGATGNANSTTVHPGAILLIRNNEGAVLIQETLVLHDASTIADNGGTFSTTISGPVQILAGTAALHTTGTISYVGSTISGTGGLRKKGSGIVRFFGAQPNTFSGGFFAEEGRVLAAKAAGTAFPGPVTVGAAGLSSNIEFEVPNQFGDNAAVRIDKDGMLYPESYSDTLGSLTLNGGGVWTSAGTLTLQSGVLAVEPDPAIVVLYCNLALPPGVTGQFTIANGVPNYPDLAFDGTVQGDAVELSGPGEMTWYGDLPAGILDSLKIKSGTAIIRGQCPGLPVTLQGGNLAGNGRVGSIVTLTSGGLQPGETIGNANNPRFLSAGVVTLNAATTCSFKLDDLNPGSGYNQLFPSTSLTLDSAVLDLTCTFDPPPGAEFMIVRSSTGVPPTGTFAGAPEGGYVSAPGAKVFQINYTGGDGDDVVLTSVEVNAPEIVSHSMKPGVEPHKGENEFDVEVKGTPGLVYLLEISTDLVMWSTAGSEMADLQTGLMDFEFFAAEDAPRLFYRARLP